jgi:hypothetical protein
MVSMQDDCIQCADDTNTIALSWQPISVEVVPYLKVIALVIMLLASWIGLRAI